MFIEVLFCIDIEMYSIVPVFIFCIILYCCLSIYFVNDKSQLLGQ